MEIQQAVRFGLFHILQAGARAEQRPIPAKGLTGTGYDGHTFWDTETFVLPVLTYTHPTAVADALRWRAMTLDINPEWVTFNFFGHPDSGHPGRLAPTRLYPQMQRPADRYLGPTRESRDFLTVSLP